MRTSDIEFIRLLPAWMREDAANIGLSKAINNMVADLDEQCNALATWDGINSLSESTLDEMAWEMNLMWYNNSASIETKRDLVRNGLRVWSKLGTPWACENVINAYFGEGYIKEWFEYDGVPNHFSVYSSNPSVNNERVQEFLHLLNIVKRRTARLDMIYITLSGEMPLHAGVGYHESSVERYKVGSAL